ncbi:uncharacterized protein LOC130734405 [Lotus japonicus]|uniref:uncharacterized protein LOC130734405 n=1 Tax=Lotus japonicus TaxID=34305 RepID=UPI002588A3FA|nr:uncharacterized protein LOC130734405 [Lotus japonicus]
MTNRIVKQRSLMQRWTTGLCPSVQQKLEISKDYSDRWTALWIGDIPMDEFEVSKNEHKYVVNLGHGTCACRRWQLSGIPCAHAVACMWHWNRALEDYVNIAYRRSTFLDTYSYLIRANNGPKLWAAVPGLRITPPYMRRDVGRPKKARRKNNDEKKNPNSLRRYNKTAQCKRCGEYRHNKRTCKGKAAADREIPIGGNQTDNKRLHPEMRKKRSAGGISINEPGSSSQQPESQPVTQDMPPPTQPSQTQPTEDMPQTRGKAKGKAVATGSGSGTAAKRKKLATGSGDAAKGKEPETGSGDAAKGKATKKRTYKGTKK